MKMKTDLTGGLDAAREYSFAKPSTTVGMRDAANMWVWDDKAEIGFPRFAVESVAPDWTMNEMQLSVGFPDGRLLRNWEPAPGHPTIGPNGLYTKIGAGPLEFECIEPFHRYRSTYDGTATDTTFNALMNREPGSKQANLQFEIECETVVPPWVQGTMSVKAAHLLASDIEGKFMGGDRLEQLCRAKGCVVVDGVERTFTGGALRIRRQGVRDAQGFWGHCWQSARFPSGRAFGYIAYPPRPDGLPSYNEGYIFLGEGSLTPARAVKAPWLTSFKFKGEEVGVLLESELGQTRIEAETIIGMPSLPTQGGFPPLFQSIVRYRWDGEQAYGMMERSNLTERVKLPG
jgi:hypothetical protein